MKIENEIETWAIDDQNKIIMLIIFVLSDFLICKLFLQVLNGWFGFYFFFALSGSFFPFGVLSSNSCATFGLFAQRYRLWLFDFNILSDIIFLKNFSNKKPSYPER